MTRHEESIVETILDFTNTIIGSAGIDELFIRVTRLLPSILPFKRTAAYRYDARNDVVTRLVTGDPAVASSSPEAGIT